MTTVDFLIVTPVLNGERFIRDCVRSVRRAFTGESYLHVIVDGGSTDGTVSAATEDADDHLTVLTSPGTSMYQALNEGLASRPARFFYQLNADDLVLPGAPAKARALFAGDASLAAVTGACLTLDLDRGSARLKVPLRDQVSIPVLAGGLFVSQPSTFVRYEVMREVGGYDTSYRYAADTALWLDLASRGYKFATTDSCFSIDRLHGGAARLSKRHVDELEALRAKYPRAKRAMWRLRHAARYAVRQVSSRAASKGTATSISLVGHPARLAASFLVTQQGVGVQVELPEARGFYPLEGQLARRDAGGVK